MVEALIKDMIMKFPPSDSPDVVGYAMYMELAPNLAHRGSFLIFLGMPPTDVDGQMYVNLAELENIPTTNGKYNIALAAVDGKGNESSFSLANDVPLDFVAPNAPGAITFVGAI